MHSICLFHIWYSLHSQIMYFFKYWQWGNWLTSISEYLQNLSDVLLFLLLPPDDFQNKSFRYILRVRVHNWKTYISQKWIIPEKYKFLWYPYITRLHMYYQVTHVLPCYTSIMDCNLYIVDSKTYGRKFIFHFFRCRVFRVSRFVKFQILVVWINKYNTGILELL